MYAPAPVLRLTPVVALLMAPALVHAAGDPDKAASYDRRGKKAYAKGRWDDAIAAFELAYKADPQPRYLFNIGRSHEQKGELATAVDFVERYLKAEEDEAEKADALETLDILKVKLAKSMRQLSVTSSPSGARIVLEAKGERIEGLTPLRRWVPQGTYRVTLTKEELSRTLDWEIGAGELLGKHVRLLPPEEAEAAKDQEIADEAPQPMAAPKQVEKPPRWPKFVIGAGVVMAVAGAVYGVLSKRAQDRMSEFETARGSPDDAKAEHDLAVSNADMANLLYIGGGAMVATGLGLVAITSTGVGLEVTWP